MKPNQAVAIVTDSSAQLPPGLVEQCQAIVVPVTVTIDGADYLEGVELTAQDFYRRVEQAASSIELGTTLPPPARFAEAFELAAANGADHALAILVGSVYSGTVNSAELAAAEAPLDVRIVDTGTASFGISGCVLAASDVLRRGGSLEQAVAASELRSAEIQSVFILQAAEMAARSGRFGSVKDEIDQAGDDIAVLHTAQGEMDVVGMVRSVDQAVSAMVAQVTSRGGPVVACVGRAGSLTASLTDQFRAKLTQCQEVIEIIDYRVGPSIAAHTGPGTAGAFWWSVGQT